MILNSLIRKELHQMRWILIIGILFGISLAVVLAATFHYLAVIVQEIPGELIELLSQYEATRELLLIFGDYSIYIWSQWNAKNLIQAGALLAIIIAASQFAGEVSRKTIGFYLTRPISRNEGYIAKIISGLLVHVIIFSSGTFFIWISSAVLGQGADWGRLTAALFVSLIWLAVYYQLGCLISSLNREPITAGVIIGLAGILLSLPGMFSASRQFSIFYQMRAVDYFISGHSLLPSIGIGLIINIIILIIGQRIFARVDF